MHISRLLLPNENMNKFTCSKFLTKPGNFNLHQTVTGTFFSAIPTIFVAIHRSVITERQLSDVMSCLISEPFGTSASTWDKPSDMSSIVMSDGGLHHIVKFSWIGMVSAANLVIRGTSGNKTSSSLPIGHFAKQNYVICQFRISSNHHQFRVITSSVCLLKHAEVTRDYGILTCSSSVQCNVRPRTIAVSWTRIHHTASYLRHIPWDYFYKHAVIPWIEPVGLLVQFVECSIVWNSSGVSIR